MLEELSAYENLGTPTYIFMLLSTLNENRDESWSTQDVRDLFFNKIVDGRSVFDGCVPLLFSVGIMSRNDKGFISLEPTFSSCLTSQGLMIDRFVEKLLTEL